MYTSPWALILLIYVVAHFLYWVHREKNFASQSWLKVMSIYTEVHISKHGEDDPTMSPLNKSNYEYKHHSRLKAQVTLTLNSN